MENKNIFIPDYLKDFINYKIERWIDSAFQARIMRDDDHFVLDISKTYKKIIKNKKLLFYLVKIQELNNIQHDGATI